MMPSLLTFITTCRDRLEHLQQTLPRMVAQPHASCVVVDYDCPAATGDWVEQTFPQVTVVRSGPMPQFEISRARNLGAAVAISEWLCFVDADTLLAPHFVESVLPIMQPGGFYVADREIGQISGMCLIKRRDFEASGGYDAVLQGWGSECKDFYRRLTMAGLERRTFSAEPIKTIVHPNELRVQHYAIKDGLLTSTINIVYCRAKWDMISMGMSMQGEREREQLYNEVFKGVLAARDREKGFTLRVPLGQLTTLSGAVLDGALTYQLSPIPASKQGF